MLSTVVPIRADARQILHLLSHDGEIGLGRQWGDQLETGLDTDPEDVGLVRSVGARIGALVGLLTDYPYEYRVLSGSDVNATALPGGRIYIGRFLLRAFASNEDEVAWVLAHETAHVALGHTTEELERQLVAEPAKRKPPGGPAPSTVPPDLRKVGGLKADWALFHYSREQEHEADQCASKYTHDAGFDPTAGVAVLCRLQELLSETATKPSLLGTELMYDLHPGNDERLKAVQDFLRTKGWHGKYWQPPN